MSGLRLLPRDAPDTLGTQVVRAVTLGLSILGLFMVVWALNFLLAPVALAFVGYYVLRPLVNLLESRGVPRQGAVLVCFGGALALIVAVGVVVWPSLDQWLQMPLAEDGQRFERQLSDRLGAWERAGQHAYPKIHWHSLFESLRSVLDAERRELMETLPTMAVGVLQRSGTFMLAPIITLFLLLDGALMRQRLVSLVPNRYFETVLMLLHRVDRQIAMYLKGAANESAVVAALLSVLLMGVGMPHALLFGCLFGVLNVIPLVGPVIGAGSGLLYALMDPAAPPLIVLLACYVGIYLLDAVLINPWVVGKSLNLHPLALILGVSIGGAWGGILGMVASVPAIAVARAVVGTLHQYVTSRRRL